MLSPMITNVLYSRGDQASTAEIKYLLDFSGLACWSMFSLPMVSHIEDRTRKSFFLHLIAKGEVTGGSTAWMARDRICFPYTRLSLLKIHAHRDHAERVDWKINRIRYCQSSVRDHCARIAAEGHRSDGLGIDRVDSR